MNRTEHLVAWSPVLSRRTVGTSRLPKCRPGSTPMTPMKMLLASLVVPVLILAALGLVGAMIAHFLFP
jgi:hypothetical protein